MRFSAVLVLCLPALCWAAPAELLGMVHADLRTVSPAEQCFTRYLVSPVEPLADDEYLTWFNVITGHLNGVSRTARLRPAYAVRCEGKLTRVFRVNLADYGLPAATWEKLGTVDPYFHYVGQGSSYKDYPQGITHQGTYYPPGKYLYGEQGLHRLGTFWTDKDDPANILLAQIQDWTQSGTPILWADWFVNQTATADGRTVSYYDLLGVKNEKDFQKLIRFDPVFNEGLEHLRALNFSGITLGPREIERNKSGFWRTRDNRHDGKEQDDQDPTVTLGGKVNFLASRAFAPLPNGLPAWLLNNNKGDLQVKAPDDVVGCDRLGKGNDGRLHINTSCWRCHNQTKTEDCIKDFKALTQSKLRSQSPEALRRLEDQYQRHRKLKSEMAIDRAGYKEAVEEMTGGWTCQKYAEAYTGAWESYELAQVDLKWAAARMMYPVEDVRKAFNANERNDSLHPLLGTMLRTDGEDKITVRQFERVYAQAQEIMLAWSYKRAGGR